MQVQPGRGAAGPSPATGEPRPAQGPAPVQGPSGPSPTRSQDTSTATAQAIGSFTEALSDDLPFPVAPTIEGLAEALSAVLRAEHDRNDDNDDWIDEVWARGADLNNAITASYVQSAGDMRALIPGVETPVWMDFGKFASREAGSSYTMIQGVTQFLTNMASPLFWAEAMASPMQMFGDVRKLVENMFEGASLAPGMKDQAVALIGAVMDQRGGLAGLAANPIGFIKGMIDTLNGLGRTLLEGNMRIQANFGPAMAAFTSAEAAGQDGVEAARKVLAEMEPHGDPTGLFAAGLTKYQQASHKAKEAAAAPTPEAREALLAEANALVAEGNVLLAAHEQNLVRDLFESEPAHSVVGRITPTMAVHDAAYPDGYELLPGGGNWADYAARMGLEPATAAEFEGNGKGPVIQVKNPKTGQVEYWRIKQPVEGGTIPGYFAAAGTGAAGAANIAAVPDPVEMHNIKDYPSILEMGRAIGRAFVDGVEAVGDAAEKVGEAVGDVAEKVGDVAENVGDAVGDAAKKVGDVAGNVGKAIGGFFGFGR